MRSIRVFKKKKEPITMITAYDYVSAKIAEIAGIDSILVGDSLGMVIAGYDNTLNVKLEQMIYHSKYVRNGALNTFIIADMPYLSYKISPKEAVKNAGRLIQEGNADAVKIEGGLEVCRLIKKLVYADIPVMGHIGLTPQGILKFGRYKKVGKKESESDYLIKSAIEMEKSGAFSIVLESIPEKIAEEITNNINIPTIGIGAGRYTTGQILVWHDVLGFYDKLKPRFAKAYKNLWDESVDGISKYIKDVKSGKFPDGEHL